MAIRQDKNYNFNFTLADGTKKQITHSVPLPVASEIGCERIIFDDKESIEQTDSIDIIIPPRGGRYNFSPGYAFDISKIDNYSVTLTGSKASATIDNLNSTQGNIVILLTNSSSLPIPVVMTIKTFVYEQIVNTQEYLTYLNEQSVIDKVNTEKIDKRSLSNENILLNGGYGKPKSCNYTIKIEKPKKVINNIVKDFILDYGVEFDYFYINTEIVLDKEWFIWYKNQSGETVYLQHNLSDCVTITDIKDGNNKGKRVTINNINIPISQDTYYITISASYTYSKKGIENSLSTLFNDLIDKNISIGGRIIEV